MMEVMLWARLEMVSELKRKPEPPFGLQGHGSPERKRDQKRSELQAALVEVDGADRCGRSMVLGMGQMVERPEMSE